MAVEVSINYMAVLVAAIAAFVVGGLWYSPLLFGKIWMKLSKVQESDMKKMKKTMVASYILGFVTTLIMSYVLTHIVDYTESTTAAAGATAGFWAWLGFVATVQVGAVLWENKPFKLFALNTLHSLVALLIMGSILATWA